MKKPLLFIVFFVVFFVLSCKKSDVIKQRQIEKASWLVGNWENKSDNGLLTESWKRENDSVFLGHTYFIKNDTLHDEFIKLSEVGAGLIYSPVVKGQNDGKAVDFKMTAASSKQLIFENPKHDFPQKITYTKITEDSLVAEISGIENGKTSKERYPMKRKIR